MDQAIANQLSIMVSDIQTLVWEHEKRLDQQDVITLRDQLAMAALTGLIQSNKPEYNTFEYACRNAYFYADEMLKAREQ